MKKLNIKARLAVQMWRFSYKNTFVRARYIWLFCVDNKIEVPYEVLKVFTEGIKTQHKDYKINNPSWGIIKFGSISDDDEVLYRYVNLWMHKEEHKRGSQIQAFENYLKLIRKRNIETTIEVIKKRYERAIIKMREIKKSWEE